MLCQAVFDELCDWHNVFDFLILKVRHNNRIVIKQGHYDTITTLTTRLAAMDFLIALSIAAMVVRVISALCCGSISNSSVLPDERISLISLAFIGLIACRQQHFSKHSHGGNERLKIGIFETDCEYHSASHHRT